MQTIAHTALKKNSDKYNNVSNNSSVVTVIEIGIETAVFLAISNPIGTAVLGSLLTVSVFRFRTGPALSLDLAPNHAREGGG